MKSVHLQPAYVLHRRPFRESSFLVNLFTIEYGVMTVVARGAYRGKSTMPGLLQAFIPLWVSWYGKGELVALTHVETREQVKRLTGDTLFAGLYLNELLMRLLQKWDAHTELYQQYAKTLRALQCTPFQSFILRAFEKYLLECLGYGVLHKSDQSLATRLLPEKYYRFLPNIGFILSEAHPLPEQETNLFLGKNLLAIASEKWQDPSILMDAKRLTYYILKPLLGDKPLYSRQLFRKKYAYR